MFFIFQVADDDVEVFGFEYCARLEGGALDTLREKIQARHESTARTPQAPTNPVHGPLSTGSEVAAQMATCNAVERGRVRRGHQRVQRAVFRQPLGEARRRTMRRPTMETTPLTTPETAFETYKMANAAVQAADVYGGLKYDEMAKFFNIQFFRQTYGRSSPEPGKTLRGPTTA